MWTFNGKVVNQNPDFVAPVLRPLIPVVPNNGMGQADQADTNLFYAAQEKYLQFARDSHPGVPDYWINPSTLNDYLPKEFGGGGK